MADGAGEIIETVMSGQFERDVHGGLCDFMAEDGIPKRLWDELARDVALEGWPTLTITTLRPRLCDMARSRMTAEEVRDWKYR